MQSKKQTKPLSALCLRRGSAVNKLSRLCRSAFHQPWEVVRHRARDRALTPEECDLILSAACYGPLRRPGWENPRITSAREAYSASAFTDKEMIPAVTHQDIDKKYLKRRYR